MEEKPIFNVSELSMYLYCPRQFYLEKVLGIRKPATKEMVEGRIIHSVVEEFSAREPEVLEIIEVFDRRKIFELFLQLVQRVKQDVFRKNSKSAYLFHIDLKELEKKIDKLLEKEILLRVEAIENTMKKGFVKNELVTNLSPRYLSEYPLFSEALGLRGRADRLVIGDDLVLYELKTRDMDRVYESDEIQIAAYALLVEEKFNKKPSLCILEAGNQGFEINTNSKKDKVFQVIEEMKNVIKEKKAKFPSNFAKCKNCKLKEECGENQ
jgi:CRISPR/Cas system-associated exonuclease Cas4 (RecB family)